MALALLMRPPTSPCHWIPSGNIGDRESSGVLFLLVRELQHNQRQVILRKRAPRMSCGGCATDTTNLTACGDLSCRVCGSFVAVDQLDRPPGPIESVLAPGRLLPVSVLQSLSTRWSRFEFLLIQYYLHEVPPLNPFWIRFTLL